MDKKVVHLGARKQAHEWAEQEIGIAGIDQLQMVLSARCPNMSERARALLKFMLGYPKKEKAVMAYIMAFFATIPRANHEIAEIRLTDIQCDRYEKEIGDLFEEAKQELTERRGDLTMAVKTFWTILRDLPDENARVFILAKLIESGLVPFTEFASAAKIPHKRWKETWDKYESQLKEVEYVLRGHQPGWSDMSASILGYLEGVPAEDRVRFLGHCLLLVADIRGACKCSQTTSALLRMIEHLE